MPVVTVQELIDAGVHYGHQSSRWNPKMNPFIYGKRHNIHVINLKETIRGLYMATHFLRKLASTGAQILFLGTKRQIRAVVDSESKRCGMPAITERWIGGTLTNFNTVRERLTRLDELEAMEADGSLERHKKKAQAMLRREMRKIQRNLEGVRDLHGLPAAIVVVDPRREDITMKEAARMNVPVVAILDTDCDPDLADIVIPGNDDAMSSVQLLLSRLVDAVVEGRSSMDDAALLAAQKSAKDDPRAREVGGRRSAPSDRPRGRRREATPGGRLGRRSGGRFADRASGHADSVSIGGDATTERKQDPAAEAPAAVPPAADAPAAGAPEAAGAAPAAEPPAAEPPAAEPPAAEPPAAEPPAAVPPAAVPPAAVPPAADAPPEAKSDPSPEAPPAGDGGTGEDKG